MTEKLFYQDSYIQEFDATVLACREESRGYEIVLDKTCFFPEGGGQSADTGTLEGTQVLDVKEKQDEIYHYTKEPLEVGSKVHGIIQFEERFSKMQQHSGEHIVSGIVHAAFGYDNVGFHLGNELVTLDFNGVITKEQLAWIEWEANQAVVKNLDICQMYPSKEALEAMAYRSKKEIGGQVRIITIPGYDVCACCAPHVRKTGEIGIIKLVGMQNYKGGVRISMLCGVRALMDYRKKEAHTKAIMNLLSAKEELLTEAVQRQKAENEELKLRCSTLLREVLFFKAKEAEIEEKNVFFETDLDGDGAREFMNQILKRGAKICAVYFGTQTDEYRYVIGSKQTDVRVIVTEMSNVFQGKGGGKAEMVQGSVKAGQKELELFWNKIMI